MGQPRDEPLWDLNPVLKNLVSMLNHCSIYGTVFPVDGH